MIELFLVLIELKIDAAKILEFLFVCFPHLNIYPS